MNVTTNDARPQNYFYVYRVALIAAVGGFLFGYDMNIISGAIVFLKDDFKLTDAMLGFVTSSASLGCIVGAIFGGAIADRFGRKKALFIAAVLFSVSALFTAIPPNLTIFNIFRIVGGVGVGLASIVSPMYIAEVSPSSIRGRLVTINQFAICAGLLAAVIVSYFLSFSAGWRWMFASEGVPILFFAFGLMVIPESPRWLMKKNRNEEAYAVLNRINGAEVARKEVIEIEKSLNVESGNIKELFQKGVRVALVIAVCLAFFQQWSGASTLLLYAPIIFQKAGFQDPSDAIFQSMILMGWLVLSTVFAFWLVERMGRRKLLIIGSLGMAVGMACTSLFFYMEMNGTLLLFMMFISIGAYCISLAPLTWLIMAEIFPNRLRGRAMSIASVVLWINTFFANQMFPSLSSLSTRLFGTEFGIFLLYAIICVITAIFVWRMLPETRGKSLEEISEFWSKRGKHAPGKINNKDEAIQAEQVI